MNSRARLLWVSPVCPLPADDGNKQRHWHLLSRVARLMHVGLVCPYSADPTSCGDLRRVCEVVRFVQPLRPPGAIRRRLREALGSPPACLVPPEIASITLEVHQLVREWKPHALFGALSTAPALFGCGDLPVVIDDQNIERDRYRLLWRHEAFGPRKLARWLDWVAVSVYERRWLPRASAVTVCSASDARGLESGVTGTEFVVVPNGVDLGSCQERARHMNADPSVVFVGGMSYAPNVDAATVLLREVMPAVWASVPDARVLLVGKDPAPEVLALAGPRVEVTGRVDSVEPYLHDATVAAIPLRSGGGTRLKILEAMGAGLPVVTTSIGAEGLGLKDQAEAVIVDDSTAMAHAIVDLLHNEGRAQRMGEAARRRVERDYSWDSAAEVLLAVVERRMRAYQGASRDPGAPLVQQS